MAPETPSATSATDASDVLGVLIRDAYLWTFCYGQASSVLTHGF